MSSKRPRLRRAAGIMGYALGGALVGGAWGANVGFGDKLNLENKMFDVSVCDGQVPKKDSKEAKDYQPTPFCAGFLSRQSVLVVSHSQDPNELANAGFQQSMRELQGEIDDPWPLVFVISVRIIATAAATVTLGELDRQIPDRSIPQSTS